MARYNTEKKRTLKRYGCEYCVYFEKECVLTITDNKCPYAEELEKYEAYTDYIKHFKERDEQDD